MIVITYDIENGTYYTIEFDAKIFYTSLRLFESYEIFKTFAVVAQRFDLSWIFNKDLTYFSDDYFATCPNEVIIFKGDIEMFNTIQSMRYDYHNL